MKQKCKYCPEKALPGLRLNTPLCQYHYNVYQFGKKWADKCKEK